MFRPRRRGFTLIELLVVIAIIGILAAMLFPVFAKAREAARRIHCLSNVKNIALAINMYLVDFDKFFPNESNMAAVTYFNTGPGGGDPETYPDICNQARHANPYLRIPVILDDYIGNRDVWKCPSARLEGGAEVIVPIGRDGNYLNNWIDNDGTWDDWGPCYVAWPTGWGGDVTDSFIQQRRASTARAGGVIGAKVFESSIMTNDAMYWRTQPSVITDPGHFITCGDCTPGDISNANHLAYPDYCKMALCGVSDYITPSDCWSPCADWVNCSWSQSCSIADLEAAYQFCIDPTTRKGYTRHAGGSNAGFLDGHAKFLRSEYLMSGADELLSSDICPCWWQPGSGT